MPGNITKATAYGVMPNSLSTAFTEQRIYPLLMAQYHDGTIQRTLLQDFVNIPESLRTWKLSKRLRAYLDPVHFPGETLPPLQLLRQFFEDHQSGNSDVGIPPASAFYFYNAVELVPYAPAGVFDPTGISFFGRHTVVFRGNWSDTTGNGPSPGRTDASIELVEVPDVAI